ncbi:MAG: hypothetical protein PHE89_05235 [Alphaproteobacteria bacterium]|nr:hypothetical protein [Alphaproteobacteria bacterium]
MNEKEEKKINKVLLSVISTERSEWRDIVLFVYSLIGLPRSACNDNWG